MGERATMVRPTDDGDWDGKDSRDHGGEGRANSWGEKEAYGEGGR